MADLKELGAEIGIGDLTRPETVAGALLGVARMFFAMAVSPDHLLAATVVASQYGPSSSPAECSKGEGFETGVLDAANRLARPTHLARGRTWPRRKLPSRFQ
jgi:hypothetical protein